MMMNESKSVGHLICVFCGLLCLVFGSGEFLGERSVGDTTKAVVEAAGH